MLLQVIHGLRDQVLSFYPKEVRAEVDASFSEMQTQAARLGLEAHLAEQAKLSFADAVTQQSEYLLMARVHFGVVDILQFELPKDLVEVLRSATRKIQAWHGLEPFRQYFVCQAAAAEGPEGALARFMLYQAIRLNLWAAKWREPDYEAMGTFAQLDSEAEWSMRELLKEPELFHKEVRPLHVLVAEAIAKLERSYNEQSDALPECGREYIELLNDYLRPVVERARALTAADAALLRDEYAPLFGGQRLGSTLLAERHPSLFPSPGAVDMRRSRLKTKLLEPTSATPRQRLIDVIEDLQKEAV